jgi:hypothetical protein
MKYDKKFGYYDSETGKAVIYDGSKKKKANHSLVGKSGLRGFTVPKIFDGYCSRALFDTLLKDDSVSA